MFLNKMYFFTFSLILMLIYAEFKYSQIYELESSRAKFQNQCIYSDVVVKRFNELSGDFELNSGYDKSDFCQNKESSYVEATNTIRDLLKAGLAVELSLDCFSQGEIQNTIISGYRRECRVSDKNCRELFRSDAVDTVWIQDSEVYDSICKL